MVVIKKQFTQRIPRPYVGKPCCLLLGSAVELGEPRKREVCVVLGSGYGESSINLVEAVGDRGCVYSVETSKEVMQKARRRAEQRGAKNIDFIHSIFEDIELGNALADLIISDCGIVHAHEKARVWHEIHRILKPGGRFVISDTFVDQPIPLTRRRAGSVHLSDFTTKDLYLETLDKAGFAHVTIIEESVPYPTPYKGRSILLSSFTVAGHRPGDHPTFDIVPELSPV